MKTKDLIKMLQEEDPTGECHVRLNGSEPIIWVESKPGYWDGPYNYIENGEDNKPTWVTSTKGNKIDIATIDLFDFAEKFNGDWNEMKKHIRVEYTYLNDDRKNQFLKNAKKECDEYNEMKNHVSKMANEIKNKRK